MTALLLIITLSFFCFFKLLTWGDWRALDLLFGAHLIYALCVAFWLNKKKYHHLLWVPALALCALTSHFVNPQASLLSFLIFVGAFQVHRKPFAILSAVAGICFLIHWTSYGTPLNPTQALLVSCMLFSPLYLLKSVTLPTFKSPLELKEFAILTISALTPLVGAAITQQIVLCFAAVAGCCILALGFSAYHMNSEKYTLAIKSAWLYAAIIFIFFPISVWVMQS